MNRNSKVKSSKSFSISTGPSVKSSQVHEKQLTMRGMAKLILKPEIRNKKDGEYFCGARFSNNIRSKANTIEVSTITLDIDNTEASINRIASKFEPNNYFIYSTYGHGKYGKGNCYRVVIPLSEPITPEFYDSCFEQLASRLGDIDYDISCKNPAQPMYLPSCHPSRSMLYEYKYKTKGKYFSPNCDFPPAHSNIDNTEIESKYNQTTNEGNRNNMLTSLIGMLFYHGIPKPTTSLLANCYNHTYFNPPLVPQEVSNIVKSIQKKEQLNAGQFEPYVYISSLDKVHNQDTGNLTRTEAFNRLNNNGNYQKSALQHGLDRRYIRTAERLAFAPGKDPIFFEGKASYSNTYIAPTIIPEEGNINFLLRHLRYLLPNPDEVDILLWFIAHLVQKPDTKILWMPVLKGGKGIGKSLLVDKVITPLLGQTNVKIAETRKVKEQFNSWCLDCQLVVFHELCPGDSDRQKSDFCRNMKSLITENRIEAHRKGVDAYEVPNCVNFLAFSNEEDAIHIPSDERRFVMLRSDATPRKSSYYNRLVSRCETRRPALRYYFENYDLSKYSPTQAPTTTYTAEIKNDSVTPLDWAINDALFVLLHKDCKAAHQGSFNKYVKRLLEANGLKIATSQEIKRAFKKYGGRTEIDSNGGKELMVNVDGKTDVVLILPNFDYTPRAELLSTETMRDSIQIANEAAEFFHKCIDENIPCDPWY